MMWANAGRYRFVFHEQSNSSQEESTQESEEASEEASECEDYEPDIIKAITITRRAPSFGVEKDYRQNLVPTQSICKARNILGIQSFWKHCAESVSELYPPALWRVLDSVLDQSKITQDKVLQAVRHVLNKEEQQLWPTSRKQIDSKLVQLVGTFHARVTRRVQIDLSHIRLNGVDKIEFHFLDPVFSWTVCANQLCKTHVLHFEYKQLSHPTTGELLYGASVRHGRLMKRACAKIPKG